MHCGREKLKQIQFWIVQNWIIQGLAVNEIMLKNLRLLYGNIYFILLYWSFYEGFIIPCYLRINEFRNYYCKPKEGYWIMLLNL